MALNFSMFPLVTFNFEAMLMIWLNSNTDLVVAVFQLMPTTFLYLSQIAKESVMWVSSPVLFILVVLHLFNFINFLNSSLFVAHVCNSKEASAKYFLNAL